MDATARMRAGFPVCAAVFFLGFVGAGEVTAQIAFTDVSAGARVDRAGESYGASWGDYNGDGFPDIFASNHRQQPSLFVNNGNGTFTDIGPTIQVWKNRPRADTHGGAWADFDADGDLDLLVSAGTGNLSQLLVNEGGRLVDRTKERGLTTVNLGGRLPVWFDYDGDKLTDFVMTQYGGIAKLYRQGPPGSFTETTSTAKVLCKRFHYAQLVDVNGDGRLNFMCSDETSHPQKIYDTARLPWKKIFDSQTPAPYLPLVRQAVDSTLADFDNDGRLDMFVIGGAQLRLSGVAQSGDRHFEAQVMGGIKGFRFVTGGKVTFTVDWNKQDQRTTTDYRRIKIGAQGVSPSSSVFTLDPANKSVQGMPKPPATQADIPMMQIGYAPAERRWTVVVWSKLGTDGPAVFSEGYLEIDSSAPITNLVPTGLWPSDKPAVPTLLMNRAGGFVAETSRAGLAIPIDCVSAAAGDFDNDMDVDLYLACRGGAENLPNRLYENLGNGTFRVVTGAGGAAGPVGVAVRTGAGTADTVVVADYDVDGFLDLFVTNGFNLRPLGFGGSNNLFRNRGNGNSWIQLDLVAAKTSRDATGARVFATANQVRQLRVQNGGYHRWSQDSTRMHFGLGSARAVTLRVEWPSGAVQTFSNVSTNRLYRIVEGGSPQAVQPKAARM